MTRPFIMFKFLRFMEIVFLISVNNSSAVDRVICLFQAQGLKTARV